jgi:hypothetical protein
MIQILLRLKEGLMVWDLGLRRTRFEAFQVVDKVVDCTVDVHGGCFGLLLVGKLKTCFREPDTFSDVAVDSIYTRADVARSSKKSARNLRANQGKLINGVLKAGLCELDARNDVTVDPVHSGDQFVSIDLWTWDSSEVTRMVSD